MRTRRLVLAAAGSLAAHALFGLAAAGASELTATSQPYQAQKVVYHNNGRGQDSGAYFKSLLKNIRNHIEAVGSELISVKVVNHGDGVSLFQLAQNDKAIAANLDELRGKGVQFLICKNTLAERKLDWKQLYGVQEADLVQSGVAELIRLQQQSYLYVHP